MPGPGAAGDSGSALLAQVARYAAAGVGGWAAWYSLVVRPTTRLCRPWGPRWLAALVSGILYRFGAFWLRFSHNAEESLRAGHWGPGKQYVMVWHPHGNFTVAALYFVSHFWATNYPGGVRGDRYVCVAPLLLRIPLLAEFLLLCHARSQDAGTFSNLLATGATVAVQPGGLAEQVATNDEEEQVFFPARLGFIRLAIRHGVPLLPVYAFGENQLYRTSAWVRRLNSWFYRNLKTGSLVVQGQGGIPTSPIIPNPLMLPVFHRGLHIRFGEPVHLGPAEDNPSDERVQAAFQLYLAGLRKLFDAHKDECLPKEVAKRGLKVVYRGANSKDGEASSFPSPPDTLQPSRL